MGLLTSAAQVLYGTKTFANDVVIKGKLRLEGEITRTARASFKLDKSGTTTDWGTKKRIAPTAISGAFTASGTTNVSVASIVPVGTKAVTLRVAVNDAVAGTECRIRETGSTSSVLEVVAQVNGINNEAQVDVQLDSSYTFDIDNNAAFDAVALIVTAVYL